MKAALSRRIAPLSILLSCVVACADPAEPDLPTADTAPREVEIGPMTRGWRAATEGDHPAAMAAYREATEQDPERAEAWIGLAREALRADELEAADEAATRAVALAPDSADARELAGRASLAADEHEAAAEHLARALELDPERARIHFPLGRAREAAGQRAEAIDAYHASADAGVLAARALVAAARLRIDALAPGDIVEDGEEADEPAEGDDEAPAPLEAAVADLDRAEELAQDDEAARRWIVAQRRRLDDKRREVERRAVSLDRRLVGSIGLLRALSSSSDLSGVFANDAHRSSGLEGLLGSSADVGYGRGGLGGLGTRGVGSGGGGSGGGGSGVGGIGLGGIGRRGSGGMGSLNLGGGGRGGASGGGSGGTAAGRERTATRTGRVTVGAVAATGLDDGDGARRIVRRNLAALRYCYEVQLQQDPQLAGRLTLALEIGDGGAVTSARAADSSLGDARVEGCMVRASRRWRFPAPTGSEATVTVPLTLATD